MPAPRQIYRNTLQETLFCVSRGLNHCIYGQVHCRVQFIRQACGKRPSCLAVDYEAERAPCVDAGVLHSITTLVKQGCITGPRRQDIAPFDSPKVELEQYPTGPHLASRLLFTVMPPVVTLAVPPTIRVPSGRQQF